MDQAVNDHRAYLYTWFHLNPDSEMTSCSIDCDKGWIGDGWCDGACNNEACDYDGGDCTEGFCGSDCPEFFLGDGFCDPVCYREECGYDGGDCKEDPGTFEDIIRNSKFDFKECSADCLKLKANKICDVECNTKECNWDGLDCYEYYCAPECHFSFLGDNECDQNCNTRKCNYDKGDCKQCSPGCNENMVGNSFCDLSCYNEECYFDMGDCDMVCRSYPYIFSNKGEDLNYAHCRKDWLGDGYCDCFCFSEECHFDFGDCNEEEKVICEKKIKSLEENIGKKKRKREIIGGNYKDN